MPRRSESKSEDKYPNDYESVSYCGSYPSRNDSRRVRQAKQARLERWRQGNPGLLMAIARRQYVEAKDDATGESILDDAGQKIFVYENMSDRFPDFTFNLTERINHPDIDLSRTGVYKQTALFEAVTANDPETFIALVERSRKLPKARRLNFNAVHAHGLNIYQYAQDHLRSTGGVFHTRTQAIIDYMHTQPEFAYVVSASHTATAATVARATTVSAAKASDTPSAAATAAAANESELPLLARSPAKAPPKKPKSGGCFSCLFGGKKRHTAAGDDDGYDYRPLDSGRR